MNAQFQARCDTLPTYFAELMQCPPLPLTPRPKLIKGPAVYAFFEGEKCVYVGRTRNLQNRIRGHLSNSHYSATFAFKEARAKLGIPRTYRKGEGRAFQFIQPNFQTEFQAQRQRLEAATLRFLSIGDKIDQYLFELYAAMELGTPLIEFDTH